MHTLDPPTSTKQGRTLFPGAKLNVSSYGGALSSERAARAFTLIMGLNFENANAHAVRGTFRKCTCAGVTTPAICNFTYRKPPPHPSMGENEAAGGRGGDGMPWTESLGD